MKSYTWHSVREKKLKQLYKEKYKRDKYIENFDISKRINILMKKVDRNPPGTYEYSILDLMTNWEEFWSEPLMGFQYPDWIEDDEIKQWVFSMVIVNLEENEIDFEKVEGYCRVRITMP